MTNPFAPEPDPADQPEYSGPSNSDSTPPTAQKAAPAEEDFHPFSFSIKENNDYDSAMVNMKFRTLEDASRYFSGDRASVLRDVLTNFGYVAQAFRKLNPGGGSARRNGSGAASNGGKPAGADEVPSWAGQPTFCQHGQKVWKSRMKKDNSGMWYGWCCAQGDRSCQTDFRNPPKN